MVVAFGTMFNNIRLVRYNKAGTQEIERITVPLSYAQKEKFYSRLQQDANMNQAVQITLPRMSFEITSITYDPIRKTSMFNRTFSPLNSDSVRSVRMAPYNFDFSLNVYVRNTEDGTQIIEQILPYFTPDYTLTADIAGLNEPIDLPIILQNVSYDPDYIGGPENLRVLTWTLNFTMKGYMYGPIANTKVIRTVNANTYNDVYNSSDSRKITVAAGAGTFKIGELLYQGDSYDTATATTFVQSWSPSTNTLIVVDTSGVLQSGKFITGVVSNAAYNIVSFSTNDFQLVNIEVSPDPNNANSNSAFGFDTTVEEFPNIT
jgi:hypothetical protein